MRARELIERDALAKLSTESLKLFIISHNPGLPGMLERKEIMKSAFILRDWVSGVITLSTRELCFSPVDARSAYYIFALRLGGVWCAGAAEFYALVLRLFDIPVALYDYRLGDLGHRTTLVCDKSDPGLPVYLIDAFVNYQYLDAADGSVLAFPDLLARIKKGEFASVQTAASPACRYFLTSDREAARSPQWFLRHARPQLLETRYGIYTYDKVTFTLEDVVEAYWKGIIAVHCGRLPVDHFVLYLNACSSYLGNFEDPGIDASFQQAVRPILARQTRVDRMTAIDSSIFSRVRDLCA